MVEKQVKRIFVEKKVGFDIEAQGIYHDLSTHLGIGGLTGVSVVHRYDIAGITEEQYQKARGTIFSEPPVDNAYDEVYPLETDADTQKKLRIVAIEYLPGQYDQRADSAEQCLQILTLVDRPVVKTAKIILLQGSLSSEEDARIRQYLINPIECREAKLEKPKSLESSMTDPPDVEIVVDFIHFTEASMAAFHRERLCP